jgi:hydrogenase nickel incorporation protein HypA/HybF
MHEASIAQSIVDLVLRHAKEHQACRVRSVEIELGALTFFNKDQVAFWVNLGFEKTPAEKAELVFRDIEGRIRCGACGYEGPLRHHQDRMDHFRLPEFSCPACKNGKAEIVEGREVVVRHITIVK